MMQPISQNVSHVPHHPREKGALYFTHPAGCRSPPRGQHWTPMAQPGLSQHMQAPPVQVSPGLHLRPQSPQLFGSVFVFTHVPEQHVSPAGQPGPPPQRHPDTSHVSPGLQT
jgi:hypothetical protein